MKTRQWLSLFLAACLVPGEAGANPVGGTVVNGGASFNNNGNLLTITNTPGTIINWQGFNIGAGETTRFVQQGASSAVLNRIVGQDPSQILGSLQSNGRVFLINPNGILFGANAQVDVNGLVASTLNITNEDFLAGRRVFDAGTSAGTVRNQGAIATPNGGFVYLIAPSVENSGVITSPRGDVMLAAGHHVQLVDSGNPDLHVVVSAPDNQALNLGQIIAQGGTVGIYGALVNQRGLVNADSAVVGENGRIVLKASRETLLEAGSMTSARGAGDGGSIHILGDHVGLTGNAQVDASGQAGGGTVLVGGEQHGGNATIQNASGTYVGADTVIRADAIASGNGGKVVVWSDGATRAYGRISARGGEASGNGGFVETSGRGYLDFRGRADLRAAHGAAGTLLLDPNDITIQTAGVTDVPLTPGPPSANYGGGPASSIITVADLQAQLAMGSVVISTAAGTGGSGSITVANALGWSFGYSLTLNANSNIAINGAITAQGDGRLVLNSGGSISQTAPINVTYLNITSLGDVNLASATNMVSNLAASVGDASNQNRNFRFLNGQALNVYSFGPLTGIAINTSGAYSAGAPDGVISLRTTSGAITQSPGAILAAKAVYAEGDNVTLTDANTAGFIAGKLTGAGGSFNYAGTGGVTVSSVDGSAGIQASGNVTLTAAAGDLNLAALVNAGAGSVTLNASGNVSGSVSGSSVVANAGNGISLTTQTQSISASNSGGSGAIAITNTGALNLLNIAQGGSGAITIDNTGALTVAAGQAVSSTTGSISLTAHSPLTVNGSVNSSAGGAITLSAGPSGSTTDQLTINGSINSSVGPGVVVSTTGPVLLRAGDAITVTGTTVGAVTQQAFLNTPVLPTLAQCIANPALPGCSGVLPTISQCIANPTLAGCSVVMPTLAQCSTDPLLAGCGAVLPTLAQCTATPTLGGCGVVLPSLAQCISVPTIAGCSAVLPSVTQCAASPTTPGCIAVIPTLAQCTATPTLPGCGSVLPTVAQCVIAPNAAGCSAVLPSLPACVTAPTTAGCTVVLPSLAQCSAAPATSGCTAVLPPLAQCIATPTADGCSAVLPTTAQCQVSPAPPGCSAVPPPTVHPSIPTADICIIAPNSALCQILSPPWGGSSSSSPVGVAMNTTVNLINTTTITKPLTAATQNTTGGTVDAKPADKPDDKVEDKKKDAISDTAGQGGKADVSKKMYCN